MPSPELSRSDELQAAFEIGAAYEASLDPLARKRGAHYTPSRTALGLAREALNLTSEPAPRVLDPTCGGGAFLVAAAEHLARRGVDPHRVVAELVMGIDIDAGAVDVSRRALRRWATGWGVDAEPRIRQGDVIDLEAGALGPGGVDVVIGNPPFGGQLAAVTARTQEARTRWRDRLGVAVSRYVDDALLVALAGRQLLGHGGVLAMVLPTSALGSTDGAAARSELLGGAAIAGFWVDRDRVFDAEVDVCAPMLVVGRARGEVNRWSGEELEVAEPQAPAPPEGNWAGLLLDADLPSIRGRRVAGTLGDHATATAGFRDQYYAIRPHVTEARSHRGSGRLVTVGLIDPGVCGWGTRSVRFDGRSWRRPSVDLDALDRTSPSVGAWYRARQVPKVLVATQSRVIEAVADPDGDLLPLTPVISVEPSDARMVRQIAAVLCAPVATRWAMDRASGRGLSAGALRLTARECLEVPWPEDGVALERAAKLLSQGDLAAFARAATEAYGLPPEPLVGWWSERLPGSCR